MSPAEILELSSAGLARAIRAKKVTSLAAMEAVLAAVFLDAGFEAARAVVLRLWGGRIGVSVSGLATHEQFIAWKISTGSDQINSIITTAAVPSQNFFATNCFGLSVVGKFFHQLFEFSAGLGERSRRIVRIITRNDGAAVIAAFVI